MVVIVETAARNTFAKALDKEGCLEAFGKKDEGMTAPIQDFWSGRKWMAAMLQTAMTIISVLPQSE